MMWFFDTEQNECSRFWYGGCGGNNNRFETQEECENLCLTKSRWGGRRRRNTSRLNPREHTHLQGKTQRFRNDSKTFSHTASLFKKAFRESSRTQQLLIEEFSNHLSFFFLERACFVSPTVFFFFFNKPSLFYEINFGTVGSNMADAHQRLSDSRLAFDSEGITESLKCVYLTGFQKSSFSCRKHLYILKAFSYKTSTTSLSFYSFCAHFDCFPFYRSTVGNSATFQMTHANTHTQEKISEFTFRVLVFSLNNLEAETWRRISVVTSEKPMNQTSNQLMDQTVKRRARIFLPVIVWRLKLNSSQTSRSGSGPLDM